MAKVYFIGCGGHARSAADIYLQQHPGALLCFVDANAQPGETIWNFPVVKRLDKKELQPVDTFFIALGSNAERKKAYLEWQPLAPISIHSKHAYLGHDSSISLGCFIGNFCHIGPNAIVGDNTIVNNGAVIEHEVKIGMHCHIGPNATVSGRTTIGDEVFIGVGATVIDKITICSNVVIGAGSTVIQPITSPGIYVGSPAKKIKGPEPV